MNYDMSAATWHAATLHGLENFPKEHIMSTRPMTAAEWGLLLVPSLLWGGSFLFNGILVRELPPFYEASEAARQPVKASDHL